MSATCNSSLLPQRVLALTLVALALPSSADQPERIFELSRALSTDGPDYQFDVTIASDGFEASGTVNPQAEIGSRFSLHTPPNDAWSDDFRSELEQFENDRNRALWCQGVMEDVNSYEEVARVGDTYVYKVVMEDDGDSKAKQKFARFVESHITLSAEDGAVLRYQMRALKPFRPVMVAKIKQFDLTIDCERSPDGRTYSQLMTVDIEGRAMMKSFKEKQRREITKLVALP